MARGFRGGHKEFFVSVVEGVMYFTYHNGSIDIEI